MSVAEVSSGDVLVTQQGPVLRLQLNRPAKKNALTADMYTTLAQALNQAQDDGAIRAVCITGVPGCFTSGNDVKDFMNNPSTGSDSPVGQFLRGIATFNKPLVAGVTGHAIGIGTTLLLHCDLVYAVDDATFQMPFVKLGLCPEAASSYLLPQLVGQRRAAELLMLNRSFTAAEAKDWGLVNEVIAADALEGTLTERVEALAAQPPACLRLTKSLMKEATQDAVSAAMEREGQHFAERLVSPEAMEAFTAFMERREADFSQFS